MKMDTDHSHDDSLMVSKGLKFNRIVLHRRCRPCFQYQTAAIASNATAISMYKESIPHHLGLDPA
jgi:hypothetical protein